MRAEMLRLGAQIGLPPRQLRGLTWGELEDLLEGDQVRYERAAALVAYGLCFIQHAMTASVAAGIGIAFSNGAKRMPPGLRVEDVFDSLPGVRKRRRGKG